MGRRRIRFSFGGGNLFKSIFLTVFRAKPNLLAAPRLDMPSFSTQSRTFFHKIGSQYMCSVLIRVTRMLWRSRFYHKFGDFSKTVRSLCQVGSDLPKPVELICIRGPVFAPDAEACQNGGAFSVSTTRWRHTLLNVSFRMATIYTLHAQRKSGVRPSRRSPYTCCNMHSGPQMDCCGNTLRWIWMAASLNTGPRPKVDTALMALVRDDVGLVFYQQVN